MGKLCRSFGVRGWAAVAVLAITGITLGARGVPAMAGGYLPGIVVREITQWPVRPAPPSPVPAVTANTPRVGTASDYLFEHVPLAEAQSRAKFHIWVPEAVPAGYQLGYVVVQRKRPTPTAELRYLQAGRSNAPLVVVEHVVQAEAPVTADAVPGAVEHFSIDGRPALYFGAQPGESPGSRTVVVMTATKSLLLDRGGVQIGITGFRSAGIDRAALRHIAASLQ